jgi:mannose-1-phosphate guanylyltransferase/mannose-6-phosphate isomerase
MDPLSLVPVILCGGAGTRLWPLSRESFPKQFLRLQGQHSLLQQTLLRCVGLHISAPLLLTSEETRYIVGEQLHEIGVDDATLMLEPVQRGTAPALCSAALKLMQLHGDALMLVLPSDHIVHDAAAFTDAVQIAARLAADGLLMTFGIPPHSPETGFGYLQAGAALTGGAYRIQGFIEKPERKTAVKLLESGDCYWNSGMFVFRCQQLIDELREYAPEVLAACEAALREGTGEGDVTRLQAEAYVRSPDISIDYALMERTSNAAMVPLQAGWSDIGSWSSVWEVTPHDEAGNSVMGDALLQDCSGCHVHASKRLVSAIGLQDLVIIDTDDALLVLPKERAQDIRQIVSRLKNDGRSECRAHRQVSRPWGSFDAIGLGPRFQVKRITVKPGAKLSLQMHHHRAEHWIVVSGTARVTDGEKTYLLTENQSTYIGVGVVHALENPGKIPLELIEVQSGSYLGEDDIVRLHDVYGRA